MRHLLAAGVLAVILAACHSSDPILVNGTPAHWRQTDTTLVRKIDAVVPAQFASSGLFMHAVNNAVEQANRSPYIRMEIYVSPEGGSAECPRTTCIVIVRQDLPYPSVEKTTVGWDSTGHIYGRGAVVRVDVGQPTAVEANALCHGVGHALGLGHSHHGGAGPCQDGRLTDWDLALINAAHEHRDR